ncbi:MAG TPA: ABC transporter ATP-binding protein [Dehalococcoidia bacterium]|nr:ABC transporter ATP-binding protein [Dehalococcoidia bacterium]
MPEILRVEALSVEYRTPDQTVRAVDGVEFALHEAQTLALLGESGCGKTTVALSVLNLLPSAGRVVAGAVHYDGHDVLTMRPQDVRHVRGAQIAMIFQDPISGLNPVLTIGTQVEEMVRAHVRTSKSESRRMAAEALRRQGMPDAERVMESYPFQLSGGMCQRVMIAIATVLRPRVLIADEPTSAVDVTVQAGILRELDGLRQHLGVAILLITHDLGVVARMADEVAVMYAGRIVEQAPAAQLFAAPRHPYTAGLFAARPRVDRPDERLRPIRGAPPELSALDGQCAFLPRCPKAVTACRTQPWPPLAEVGDGQRAACYNPMLAET